MTELSNLESSLEQNKSENKSLNLQLEKIAAVNNNPNNRPFSLSNNMLKELENMIHEETDERISSQKILEKRSSNIKAEVLAEKTNNQSIIKSRHDLEGTI